MQITWITYEQLPLCGMLLDPYERKALNTSLFYFILISSAIYFHLMGKILNV